MLNKIDFSPYFYSPEKLAEKVLTEYFKIKAPSFPINPFDILECFGIVYQFRDFNKLEGVYILPVNEDDIPVIGINNKRPLARQRYTACHELCHHIKDRILSPENELTCMANNNSPKERFAEDFAGYLLMPTSDMIKISNKYLVDGYIPFESAIYISDYFGVSFKSCVCTLAYRLRRIDGDISKKNLNKRIEKFKPNAKRQEFGLPIYDKRLLQNIINSYTFLWEKETGIIWNKFKMNFVYNENKLEGIEISEEEVAEIVTDLRLHRQDSIYCCNEHSCFVEVAGHSSLYDYIMDSEEGISAYKILHLHKILFQYAPYPDEAGKTRITNNHVQNAKFETVPYTDIALELVILDQQVTFLLSNQAMLSVTEYIDECVRIHHKITVIHPFNDGNGRIARIFLNWLFKLKGLPPVYLTHTTKQDYYNALEQADTSNNYDELNNMFYREVIRSMMQLNRSYNI